MSRENVATIQRIFDRWRAGDFALDAFDSDVEWDVSTMPDGGVYRGRAAVGRYLRKWAGTWDEYQLTLERLIDAGDYVVAFTRESGRGRASGVPMAAGEWAMLFVVRKGLVVQWKDFLDRSEALKAAGLSE
jgi:ketosteroid isomerase-like protein